MVNFGYFIRKRLKLKTFGFYQTIFICLTAFTLWHCFFMPLSKAASVEEGLREAAEEPGVQNLNDKDRLYEIEALINKKQSEIEQVKESIESYRGERRIKDEEYQSARKRLDENDKKWRRLYDEKLRLSKELKLSTDNLLRKKILLNERIKAAYKNSFRKKSGLMLKARSFVEFYVNLNYLTRIIKFDTVFIADILKKVDMVKKQRIELGNKIKELEIINRESLDYEKNLKISSSKIGGQLSVLFEKELALKQELGVLYLEKERIEKLVVEPRRPVETKPEAEPEIVKNVQANENEGAIENVDAVEKKTDVVDISKLALSWPLKRSKSVRSFYGTQKDLKYNVNYFNSGIDIAGDFNEEVLAAFDGRIKYKGEMKSVGKLIIIDHGGNVTTLYSHLGMIDAGMGQQIKRGETVGRLREKSAADNTSKPFLHFEVRINGNTKDPMDYL